MMMEEGKDHYRYPLTSIQERNIEKHGSEFLKNNIIFVVMSKLTGKISSDSVRNERNIDRTSLFHCLKKYLDMFQNVSKAGIYHSGSISERCKLNK